MRQYETFELRFQVAPPAGSWVEIDLTAAFTHANETKTVRGFYAGDGQYIIRFCPSFAGHYSWQISGIVTSAGEVDCEPAAPGRHGRVCRDGLHFRYEDGSRYLPFGTTIYALLHQEPALIDRTMTSLAAAPFNKVRLCVFPKDYDYNKNEPEFYAFEKTDGQWDVHRPCMPFWDALDNRLNQLSSLGIEADLIIFHPYDNDRWGFARLSQTECHVYLDYLTRRLAALPNVWWSLANEYDLMTEFEASWWPGFAGFIAERDPFGHLLSNHNFIRYWDFNEPHTSHCCIQGNNVEDVAIFQERFGKPVIFDECRYEGNLPHSWGNISAFEMVNRFWKVCTVGGYCTHGETYLNPEGIVWWSRGGRLIGDSPARIGFLKDLLDSLPGPLKPFKGQRSFDPENIKAASSQLPADMADTPIVKVILSMSKEELHRLAAVTKSFIGHYGDEVYLQYLERQCASSVTMDLPADKTYRIEVIDSWAMTRTVVRDNVSGSVMVTLPCREGIAVLATRSEA